MDVRITCDFYQFFIGFATFFVTALIIYVLVIFVSDFFGLWFAFALTFHLNILMLFFIIAIILILIGLVIINVLAVDDVTFYIGCNLFIQIFHLDFIPWSFVFVLLFGAIIRLDGSPKVSRSIRGQIFSLMNIQLFKYNPLALFKPDLIIFL